MNFKLIIILSLSLFIFSCQQPIENKTNKINFEFDNRYRNSGFALIYNEKLKKIKMLETRSLNIYHKSLKKKSTVKITNPDNGKYVIAEVKSNRVNFSDFYNSVLSLRIAEELDLNINEPYIEIIQVPQNSTFIAKKTKIYDEERSVAEKAPVDGIQINDLNKKKIEKK